MALGTVASRFFLAHQRVLAIGIAVVAKVKEPFNPFYAVLLLAGLLFAVSACAYGVMAFTALRNGPIVDGPSSGQQLLVFLDDHGGKLLTSELVLLGIATVGVIGWDQRATRIAEEKRLAESESPGEATSGELP